VRAIPIGMIPVDESVFFAEVDRILHSEELRNSEIQRRLLKFLADKSILGEADNLKEYAVAIDGLGKSTSYDPRQNSAVRIQIGRLRQSLAEYYRTEGKQDDLIIDLPKGHFKLTCLSRSESAKSPPPSSPAPVELASGFRLTSTLWNRILLISAVLVLLVFGISTLLQQWRMHTAAATSFPGWTSDLQELWGPIVDSKLPLVLTIEDPLFVELRSEPGVYYRDRSLNKWEDIVASPTVTALQRSMKSSSLQPSRYYTAFGEVEVAYHLGMLLGPREQNLSIVKTSQLSWKQLADNNIIFVGKQDIFFDPQLRDMPLELQLTPIEQGIHNLHPQSGEPAFFMDDYTTAPSEEGVAYALVTHSSGPVGSHDIVSFTSSRSAGYVGAIQWFTDPTLAGQLVAKLKGSNKEMPRYYQVLFRVKFKDDVPLETTYILSRKLH
jgi:hypothetical protein